MSGSSPRRRERNAATEPRYVKGDRVFVGAPRGPRLPGGVVGHHVDWNLYRVVYVVGIVRRAPRAVEDWRLSPRREGEER